MSDIRTKTYELLKSWRLKNLRCGYDEEEGFPLIDALTPADENISFGEEEVYLIADAISSEVFSGTYKPNVKESFEEKLRNLINCNSMENASNTADFILAQYLNSCLLAFDTAVQQRETCYGRDSRPSQTIQDQVRPARS